MESEKDPCETRLGKRDLWSVHGGVPLVAKWIPRWSCACGCGKCHLCFCDVHFLTETDHLAYGQVWGGHRWPKPSLPHFDPKAILCFPECDPPLRRPIYANLAFRNEDCVLQQPRSLGANKRKNSLTIFYPIGTIPSSAVEYNEGRTQHVRVHGLHNMVAWLLGW